ncbi:hypothetical protein GPY51_22450 [Photorhabdus laumondii subsp. laumondii]|uniref:Photorhabdus luminescens subsp. laumondii TTO1 complete genome segment 4/17 n=2 Tax=Photorhabdus laumondii subsp. laumondii TaxID=141679 RepID=Q7N7R7_PHOLL|nr:MULTISPECIES: hypothetical protein [Photorhabdus]AWK40954.1 hypothetical protein A4R40_05175 [Photorhabdus laumondii subsp. laumondii]AXG41762.1 hypothetical protein PluDJC_05335 [Photorhabdus laumondii subsp. laumondii]AXG46291.1 hypothetical protein PluTT01m_05350 [Photorhabdus laumondii subsp. laumondii]KTL62641.1 hypothetical protein AA106_19820 [Photorhabdus laumondii subsp. laumondii]MBS9439607.1 hypothetical protein [Photorhabdus noenieputensis]
MLQNSLYLCHQGQRDEQLDRFFFINTGVCSVSVMADGFSHCHASPHYVDWLGEQLYALENTGSCCNELCGEVLRILSCNDCYPGKASIAVIVSDQEKYRYATLGDTRIYWPSHSFRTTDHSLAQRCIDRGNCPAEKLRDHPLRNQLTQFAGADSKHTLTWSERERTYHDAIIMCTDGFWSHFDDRFIHEIQTEASLHNAFSGMINKKTVPEDNVSVVLLRDL